MEQTEKEKPLARGPYLNNLDRKRDNYITKENFY